MLPGRAFSAMSSLPASSSGAPWPTLAIPSERLAEAIRRRGDEVVRSGEYIGTFELCAWCAMRRRPLDLIIGAHVESLIDKYPLLQGFVDAGNEKPRATISGCRWDGKLQDWAAVHDAYQERLCHYVVAFKFDSNAAAKEDTFVKLALQLKSLGYVMLPTAAQGDCGIDALCFWDADCRGTGPAEWKTLRLELRNFMHLTPIP